MADQADKAQEYIDRALADYLKRMREKQGKKLPTAECELCGEVAPVLNGICVPCRDRYRL